MKAEPADSELLETFVLEEGQALLHLAFLLTGGQVAAAQDLVQTVLLRLVRRGVGDIADLHGYARRALLNEQRSVGRRAQAYRRALVRFGPATDVVNVGAAVEDRVVVLEALRSLKPRERAALVLRYYEDLPDAEIAELLGVSRSTVRSLVHRALPRLRQVIGVTAGASRVPDREDS